MSVVKADAYGHGQNEVAEALQKIGCRHFAVSNIDEAVSLRTHGIKGQILILGYTPVSAVPELINYDITQALLSEEYARALGNNRIKAQFAIDTGMNRIGLDADSPGECADVIRHFSRIFNLTGIFTHLCVADTPSAHDFTSMQIMKFREVTDAVKDLHLSYIHCLNSAGGLWEKPFGNLVRLGIVLYGLKPDFNNILPEGIRPVLSWKSVVSMVKKVRAGETVGYGRSFKADRNMSVATVTTGYADGYNRLLSNKGCVIVHGKKAPVVGRICMDQFMVDVTDVPQVKFGDEVILLGDSCTADDMAHCIGTIGYEIVCNIGKRVPRVYMM